jgi:cell fate (sporulation/competence/biofilm development) regulator YlbF (YheA/YmcA/DUF963 family)
MNDIIEKADTVGEAIAESERYAALLAAREAVDEDEALQAEMKKLNELRDRIEALEKDTKPVEPDDKHALRDLQSKVSGHASIQKMLRAEADFAELMNRVNRALYGALKT